MVNTVRQENSQRPQSYWSHVFLELVLEQHKALYTVVQKPGCHHTCPGLCSKQAAVQHIQHWLQKFSIGAGKLVAKACHRWREGGQRVGEDLNRTCECQILFPLSQATLPFCGHMPAKFLAYFWEDPQAIGSLRIGRYVKQFFYILLLITSATTGYRAHSFRVAALAPVVGDRIGWKTRSILSYPINLYNSLNNWLVPSWQKKAGDKLI